MIRQDKIYTSLCVLFSVIIVVGNLTYQKFVSLKFLPFHTFQLSVGAILYPLTYLITDLITEFFGKEKAQFCVRFAVVMNIMTATIITCMDYLPATSWSKINNEIFHQLTKGKHLWVRNNGSTAVSLLVDTLIVIGFMTFFGILPKDQMYTLVLNSYSFKLFFTVCSTPLFYLAVRLIRLIIARDSKVVLQT